MYNAFIFSVTCVSDSTNYMYVILILFPSGGQNHTELLLFVICVVILK